MIRKGIMKREYLAETGIEIGQVGSATVWAGAHRGAVKPRGPLVGKKFGVVLAAEFSDWQIYSLVHMITEFGGTLEFVLVDWVAWKNTRPTIASKGVEGTWGLHVDPIQTIATNRGGTAVSMRKADPKSYDGIIVPSGHSADVMLSEQEVWKFVKAAYDNGAVMGAIGSGSMPLIRTGIMAGRKCTGDPAVAWMLEKIGHYDGLSPVVVDGRVVTARDTRATPAFIRALCAVFAPGFVDPREGSWRGLRVLMIAGEDYEDIEMCTMALETLYRGGSLTCALPAAPERCRPASAYGRSDLVIGSLGTSIPFQEVPLSDYAVRPLNQIGCDEFDIVMVPGGYGPWNLIMGGEAVPFLKDAWAAGKIVAAICHGPIVTAAAGIVSGKKCTGINNCIDAIRIGGGEFHEEWAAAIDGKFVSGQSPWSVPEFLDAIAECAAREGLVQEPPAEVPIAMGTHRRADR
jgi:protease I